MSNQIKSFTNRLIFNKYRVIKRLGKGTFGYVYLVLYNNKFYAMKLEDKEKGFYILEKELYLMKYLYGPRIPYVKGYGQYDKFNVLIMELLGKSLEDILDILPNKKMSIQCVCKLSYQMIQILEHIHKKYFIHRDIKPSNFIMGIGPNSKYVYIIDLGFSKSYRNLKTLKHNPMEKNQGLTGTSRYASINTLKGFTQSRRDDLESLAYSILHLAKGSLPWFDIKSYDKDTLNKKILKAKLDINTKILCENLPTQFEEFFCYVKNLKYEEEPNYNYLKHLFLNALLINGNQMDYLYDWDNKINDDIFNFNYNNESNYYKNNYNFYYNNINNTADDINRINIEKLFNNENILKQNYEQQKQISINSGIYKLNEINESGIEQYPIENQAIKEIIRKKRLKEGGCECCIII